MHPKITSLQTLLEFLPSCSQREYIEIARKLDLDREELEPYLFWSKESYMRNCIVRTDRYELIALCWEAYQETAIHCHGGEECWVAVLEGEITEQIYLDKEGSFELVKEVNLTKGGISYMNDDLGYHRLANPTAARAISLHLYVNPIDACTVYNEQLNSLSSKLLEYDSYAGKRVAKALKVLS